MEDFFSPLLLRAFPKLQLNKPNQLGHMELRSCGASSKLEALWETEWQAWQHPCKDVSTYLSFPKSLILSFP